MTIRKRLARSNLIMILIPVAIAAALLLLGGGLAVLLLKRAYLPRLGLSMAALHERASSWKRRLTARKQLPQFMAARSFWRCWRQSALRISI